MIRNSDKCMPVDYFKVHSPTNNIMSYDNFTAPDAEALRFRTVMPKSSGVVVSGNGFVVSGDASAARSVKNLLSGFVYSNRPVRIDEIVCIHFTKFVEQFLNNGFGLGFTQPISEMHLGENKEHICLKIRADNYYKQGNILHFHVNSAGDVLYGINGRDVGQVCSKIDASRPFWMVAELSIFNTITLVNPHDILHRWGIDIQRSHDQISAGRTVSEQNQPPAFFRKQRYVSITSQHPPTSTEECIICSGNAANAVFLECGHICTCFECALKQWRGPGDGRCPICRINIQQVQRTSNR